MRSKPISTFGKLFFFFAGALIIFVVGATLRNRIAPPADAAERVVVSENEDTVTSQTDLENEVEALPEQVEMSPQEVEADPEENSELTGVQQQVAGGLTIEANNLRFEEDESGGVTVKLDICFPMPTNVDWSIYSATLSFSGFAVGDYGTIPIEILFVNDDGTALVYEYANDQFTTFERPALESENSHRCDTLYFWGQPKEVQESELKITINGLSADPYEGQTCTTELLAKAQQVMDARTEGIILACSKDGSGFGGLTISQIPEAISQETADEIFFSTDFYLDVFGVRGPWEFIYPE